MDLMQYSQILEALGVHVIADFGYVDDLAEMVFDNFPIVHCRKLLEAASTILNVGSREEEPQSPNHEVEEVALSLFATWRCGDSCSESEYSPRIRRRFRQLVEEHEARSQGSTSSMARSGKPVGGQWVLLDSGANEVIRSVDPDEKAVEGRSSESLSVTLASGDVITAFRNRSGEVCMPRADSSGEPQDAAGS